jgi:hypothetical protein
MSTPYSSGARPHHCGAYIEDHLFDNHRLVCPTEIDYPELERRSS